MLCSSAPRFFPECWISPIEHLRALQGTGAGAAVLAWDEGRLLAIRLGADGQREPPVLPGTGGGILLRMDGGAVFRFAVEAVPRCIGELLADTADAGSGGRGGLSSSQCRIISHVIRQLKSRSGKGFT